MDELSKNVVPEPVCDSPNPNESQTSDKKYYSATQTDVWVMVTCEKDGSTDTQYVLFASLERKNYFLIAVVVRISFFLIVKVRAKRIKCVSQTCVIFLRLRPATHIWCEPHHMGAATPYARCRLRLARVRD